MLAYLLAMLLAACMQLSAFMGQGVGVAKMRQGIECYIWMTALQFCLILLVAPALSAGSIAGERERQTFDLLLVTGTGTKSMIIGKLMEHFAFLALLILCSAPVMAVVLITGGVQLADVWMTILYLMAIAFAALSVGMLASVLFKRTLVAVIMAYLLIFAIGAGTWLLAKHGPLAAAYTYEMLNTFAEMPEAQVIAAIPPTVFFNPAIGLVMLLAGQTGILHRTMESTMRLYQIYTVCKIAGFTGIAYLVLGATVLASGCFTAVSCAILHMQTGGMWKRK